MFFVYVVLNILIDETLLIKYKPKHPKKGEYKEQNGRTHVQKDKKNHQRRRITRGEHQVLGPLQSQEAYQIKKGEDLLKGCLT